MSPSRSPHGGIHSLPHAGQSLAAQGFYQQVLGEEWQGQPRLGGDGGEGWGSRDSQGLVGMGGGSRGSSF